MSRFTLRLGSRDVSFAILKTVLHLDHRTPPFGSTRWLEGYKIHHWLNNHNGHNGHERTKMLQEQTQRIMSRNQSELLP